VAELLAARCLAFGAPLEAKLAQLDVPERSHRLRINGRKLWPSPVQAPPVFALP